MSVENQLHIHGLIYVAIIVAGSGGGTSRGYDLLAGGPCHYLTRMESEMSSERQSTTIVAIRNAEMQIARQLAAAGEEGKRRIAEAQSVAEIRIQSAKREGFQYGQSERASFLAEIDEEANHIVSEAEAAATRLRGN